MCCEQLRDLAYRVGSEIVLSQPAAGMNLIGTAQALHATCTDTPSFGHAKSLTAQRRAAYVREARTALITYRTTYPHTPLAQAINPSGDIFIKPL